MFSIYCSHRISQTPAFFKHLCHFQPIMLRLWIIQVSFVTKLISYWFLILTYCYSCKCRTYTIISIYFNLRIASDHVSQCSAECFSRGNSFSHILCYCFCNPCETLVKTGWWHTKIFKEKELIMQSQIFHKHVEFNFLFPFRRTFHYPIFFVFYWIFL